MPRQSETNNVKKLCACGRPKWGGCAHPWYVDYKAPKTHRRRPNERYRKNLDQAIGFHAETLTDAKIEAQRAIIAWLDGKNPADLQAGDWPTLAQVLTEYRKRPDAATGEAWQVKPITETKVDGRPFGEWRLADVTTAALRTFQAARPKVAGNRNLALLRALFKWAIGQDLILTSPFRKDALIVVKLRKEAARTRRLHAGEEDALLLHANGLAPLIVAALESGCRSGELVSLQWHQVRAGVLFLPGQKTKTRRSRTVPISGRLRTVLDARRNDPAGDPLPPEAFVFGDEVGRRRGAFKTAWGLTCKRAKITDLHFHDLRREAGSRWMDAGIPLATIQRWLGHTNIAQTSTYLSASLGGDEAAMMAAFEQKMGRETPAAKEGVSPLPQIDTSPGSNGIEPTSSDIGLTGNAQQSLNGHDPVVTIH